MGKPKEFLPWKGSALLTHVVYTLLDCSYPVLVVARDARQVLPPLPTECDVILDREPGAGPLAAIETGLLAMAGSCDFVLVSSCDQPFLDREAVAWMCDRMDPQSMGLVPEFDGHPQPLCAIYRPGILPALQELRRQGEARASCLAGISGVQRVGEEEIRSFDPKGRFLQNYNTPEEFEAASSSLKESEGSQEASG
jgi:molybdopterin-guanine dinucleotide biosynthesis protein A